MEASASLGPDPDEPEGGAARAGDAPGRDRVLRLVAQREHELRALAELSQELTVSLDRYGAADLILFNLMGQAGTSRAALWLVAEDRAPGLVLLRHHGIGKNVAIALGNAVPRALAERMGSERRTLLADELAHALPPAGTLLLSDEPLAMLAPVCSRGQLRGLVALGPRIGGEAYGPVELQVIETALGMVGVALENISLYNRLFENHRQLRRANERLLELDELKTAFLNNVNHELRTPLSVIIAYLQHLAEAPGMESKTREFLNVCLAESLKLKGLFESLLDFSEITADRMRMQLERGVVAQVLRPYCEERVPGISEGMRELTLSVASGVPEAQFDRHRLVQIVDLLVDNAVKFTPRGTHIDIRVRRLADAGREWIAVEVCDDGPGIPPERMPTLFQLFRQGDGSLTRRVGGLGLGLSFARELAEKMGGRLDVESELGSGSVFRLILAAAD